MSFSNSSKSLGFTILGFLPLPLVAVLDTGHVPAYFMLLLVSFCFSAIAFYRAAQLQTARAWRKIYILAMSFPLSVLVVMGVLSGYAALQNT